MKRILTFFSVALIVVAGTVSCDNDPKADGVAQITSFSLQSSLNSNLSSNVDGTIDEQAKTISLVLPEGSGSSFIPTFTVTDDDVVKAGATVVTSGVTSISITDGAQLSVTDEVSELNVAYTLSVKENDGAAELKSVSFLKADNSVLTADVAPEAIASEMIARVPSAAFKQELILTVEAGLNDVVKVNGKETTNGKIKVDTSFPIDITVTDEVAKTTASYVLKVGKVLGYVVTKITTYSEGTKINDIDMAINPKDGTPWIAYSKKEEGSVRERVAVVRLNGDSFSHIGETSISEDVKNATKPCLTFTKEGTAFLKYVGGEVNNKNTVRKFTTTWEICGEAGFNSANVHTLFSNNSMYVQSNGYPAFFYTPKTGADKYHFKSEYYDGSKWVEGKASSNNVAPEYNGDTGIYYESVYASHKGKTYMLSSFNKYGYYLYEVGDQCSLTPIISDFKPGTAEYGLPNNLKLESDGDDLFAFAADATVPKMQVYKIDLEAKKFVEYGNGLSVTIGGLLNSVQQSASFAVAPNGTIVAAISDSENIPSFKYISSSKQWEDFSIKEKPSEISSSSKYIIHFNSKGEGYIAYTNSDSKIEVYKIALEADVLPE